LLQRSCWCVQLYKTDETMELIHIAATFQFAVRALAFSPVGDRLAAAGDDPSLAIIHVDVEDESSVPHTFNIGPNTRGLAWDPQGTYLAVAQTNGSLRLWDASSLSEVWMDKSGCVV
jgi:WD40 repeat protein